MEETSGHDELGEDRTRRRVRLGGGEQWAVRQGPSFGARGSRWAGTCHELRSQAWVRVENGLSVL